MSRRANELLNNWYSPNWWRSKALPFLYSEASHRASRVVYPLRKSPNSLMDCDWDNALLLDACRYDLFEEANEFSGDLDSRISVGSATQEFVNRAFDGETFHDTVYVTANPMYVVEEVGEPFHEIIDVWEDFWDDELRTVTPEAMTEAALEANREYPDKRLLVHFMQPHYPFIGDLADDIGTHSGFERSYRKAAGGEGKAVGDEGESDDPTVWQLLERGEVDEETVWAAYRENLELTFPSLRTLREELEGKTVVTSDHGNMLGERPLPLGPRTYGHPKGLHCDELCKVPWLVFEHDSRKEVVSEAPSATESSATVDEEVNSRLADLGYVNP